MKERELRLGRVTLRWGFVFRVFPRHGIRGVRFYGVTCGHRMFGLSRWVTTAHGDEHLLAQINRDVPEHIALSWAQSAFAAATKGET